MDGEGVFYGALFLILIAPCAWYLWKQLGRIGELPRTADGRADVDALLARHGYRMNAEWKEHLWRVETEGAIYYREKFRTAPLGEWFAHGLEPQLMGEAWTFRPDHTGEVMRTEAFGYPRERTLFEWREAGDLAIEARVTARQACVSCEPQGPPVWGPHPDWEEEGEAVPETWECIRYDFRRLEEPVPTLVMHCPGHADFFALGCFPLAPLEWHLPLRNG